MARTAAECVLMMYAVQKRCFSAGANPIHPPPQPEAIGSVQEGDKVIDAPLWDAPRDSDSPALTT